MYSMDKQGIDMDIQLKKGILDICVLYSLEQGESYGYKIIADLNGIIEISESTLYPILKRLEASGFLVTRTAEYSGRLRRYYKITPSGQKKLEDGRDDLKQIVTVFKKIGGNL